MGRGESSHRWPARVPALVRAQVERGLYGREVILGREDERATISALLTAAREGRGASLCLVGEPGIGKSTLLQWACDEATGLDVVRTTGVESAFDVGYAGLLDVLSPLRQHLDGVPPGQRAALEGALGWSSEQHEVAHPLVAAATMTLLSCSAEHSPVLVVVDDLQWVDPEAVHALAFAARRLSHDGVAFLLARRDSHEVAEAADVPALRLEGVSATDASRLLVGVAASVVERLVTATAGNPLALLDTVASLTPEQRRGAAELPQPPPLGDRLLQGFAGGLAALSEEARRAATLVAASHDATPGPVVEALAIEGIAAEAALDEAAEHGVLVVGTEVVFRHPLLRGAVWSATSDSDRRSAHRSLALVDFAAPTVRLRHRVAATTGFDDDLSVLVEERWREERGTLGYASASELAEHAARLSSSRSRAAVLRAAAAEDALVAGDLQRARAMATRVTAEQEHREAHARALLVLGILEEYAGSVPRSRSLLTEAAECGRGLVRLRALGELAIVGYRLGDPAAMSSAATSMAAEVDSTDPEQQMLADYVQGAAAAFGGRWEECRPSMMRAVQLLESDPRLREDPRYLVHALSACAWLRDIELAATFADRRMRTARDTGALGVLPFALSLLAGGYTVLGDHWAAYAHAGEGVDLGTELGFVVDVSTSLELMAAQLAARGTHEGAAEALSEARRLGEVAGVASSAVQIELMTAYAALCRRDFATTISVLEQRLAADEGRLPNGDYPLGVAPDLVEAYLAVDRQDDAASLARRHADLHLRSDVPVARAWAQRLLGMTLPDVRAATECFEAALQEHELVPDAYQTGRTRLVYGARLRREGQRRRSREHLRAAEEAFDLVGFDAWAERARDELAATGERARRGPSRDDALTGQETRVALLVAQGLTNKEIAATLFLSPKTVEHHVTAALRKTGVRRRTELAVALSARPAPGGSSAAT